MTASVPFSSADLSRLSGSYPATADLLTGQKACHRGVAVRNSLLFALPFMQGGRGKESCVGVLLWALGVRNNTYVARYAQRHPAQCTINTRQALLWLRVVLYWFIASI